MRAKIFVSVVLMAGLIWAIAAVMNARHQAAERKPLEAAKAQGVAEFAPQNQSVPSPVESPAVTLAPEPTPPVAVEPARVLFDAAPTVKTQKVAQLKQPKLKEPLRDPDARAALSLVGADPDAEAYWYSAINDPNIPAEERKDLIEDLNEDGISDPKNPSQEDLPVILRRLELVEAIGEGAMDKVNADAFDEAYKDLVNLARLASGSGGEPVK